MVNSGSIVVNALLQNLMQPDMSGAEKFDYLNDYIKVKHGICNSKCWMEYPDIAPNHGSRSMERANDHKLMQS